MLQQFRVIVSVCAKMASEPHGAEVLPLATSAVPASPTTCSSISLQCASAPGRAVCLDVCHSRRCGAQWKGLRKRSYRQGRRVVNMNGLPGAAEMCGGNCAVEIADVDENKRIKINKTVLKRPKIFHSA